MERERGVTISLRVAVTLLLFLPATGAVLPNGQCSVEGMTCEFQDENLIGIIDGVMSAEECKQECKNNSTECRVYSYYGLAGAPFSDTCLLFRECQVLDPVEECFTEDIDCVIFCNAPVEGQLGSENLLDIVSDINEGDCEDLCNVEEQCKFFTFHFSNSTLYPSTCFLLREIQGPIIPCQDDTCTTVSSKCENSLCIFLEDGVLVPNGIILNETKDVDILTIGPCSAGANVLAMVVGGGGSWNGGGGGPGSGYVEFQELPSSQPFVQFDATVGSSDEQSTLSTISNGSSNVLVTALPGESVMNSNNGCDGYSGGGAYCCSGVVGSGGDGGMDGSDGQDSSDYTGGQGSGLDVRTIPLTHFELR